MKELIIIGAGGHGKEVAFLASRLSEYKLIGFLDDNRIGEIIYGYPVIGGVSDIVNLDLLTSVAFGIASPKSKVDIYNKIISPYSERFVFPNLIDPSAIIGRNVSFGKGNIIMANTTFTSDIKIGDFNMINIGCTIGHDVTMAHYNSIYPSVNVSGNVEIENKTEIGVGSQIIQNIHVGESAVIGAGSVVLNKVENYEKVVGVPARRILKGGENYE